MLSEFIAALNAAGSTVRIDGAAQIAVKKVECLLGFEDFFGVT